MLGLCKNINARKLQLRLSFQRLLTRVMKPSLSGSIGSQKAPLKREVELEEETTRKFSKSCDEARIPETKAMTFNQCTFIISKD